MSFLTGLFGLSGLQAKAIEIVAVVLIAVSTYVAFAFHYEHKGALGELAKLQTSSTALLKTAQDTITRNDTQHAAENAANAEKLDEANHLVQLAVDARDNSVRNFDAYRHSHPDVARTGGGSDAASGGECGVVSCGDLASSLAKAGNELAGANGELSNALASCQRDRDDLTGRPK